MTRICTACACLVLLIGAPAHATAEEVRIGSKKFTESVILGEVATQAIAGTGTPTVHLRELGGTRVLWNALRNGDIDAYPEYTGTLRQEIFTGALPDTGSALAEALAREGLRATPPLGFNNSYALGMRREQAQALGIGRITDLRAHPGLRLGFSNEFLDRGDGWPGLKAHYGLTQRDVRGLDHDLAYRGLTGGDLDVIDLYATDAEIDYYGLTVLTDDGNFFPAYDAVYLYRADLETRYAPAVEALRGMSGHIDETAMRAMNAGTKLDRTPENRVAAAFLNTHLGMTADLQAPPSLWRSVLGRTGEHLTLVGISLGAAILIAIPLGIASAASIRGGQIILSLAGVVQTIPSLALLVFMIPVLGIGGPPAIMALFLYSLLPIIRNTATGLRGIPLEIRESAQALGLSAIDRLRLVELPMAMPTLLAGIKTAAVINVGTATLGALIGAGGYGQPILTGIRLDDMGLILQGAIPAAVLALLVQGLFELAERYWIPRGLKS